MRYFTFLSFLISSASSASTLIQFPNGTWLENIAVLSNNGILLTELGPEPVLLYIDPSLNPLSAQTVYKFPSPATGLTGIAKLGEDIFYVVSLTFNLTTSQVYPGSGQLWQVNMTNYSDSGATVVQVVNLTNIAFPNGTTALPDSSVVLIADYVSGKVFSVNVDNGVAHVAVDDPTVNVPFGATVGVNGVHAPGNGFLYFTNSGANSYGRVPIDNCTGNSTGDGQILFQSLVVIKLCVVGVNNFTVSLKLTLRALVFT